MTKRASELIKELTGLNEKVYKLELELKEELTRELTEKFVFTTREEAIKYLSEANEGYNDFLKATADGTTKQPVPENKEYKKDNYERYKETDIDKYYEDPYDDDEPEEDYIWEDPTNEACWDCNNPRCKKGRLNSPLCDNCPFLISGVYYDDDEHEECMFNVDPHDYDCYYDTEI